MDARAYAELQSAFLRLVTPMKREFGVAVDVPRLRTDRDYAIRVVAQALAGREPHLRAAAAHIEAWLAAAMQRDAARALTTHAASTSSHPA